MRRSRDFGWAFVAKWRQGEMPRAREGNTVVADHDGNFLAYDIEPDAMAEFVEWVAANWESDRKPRGWNDETGEQFDESAQAYLDRRCIAISTI
jgi:hypothetical protein